MSLLVKLGIGGVALAGLSTVAVLSTSALSEPTAKTLSEYTSTSNDEYKDKLGGIEENKKLLVSSKEENREWWDWVYKNRFLPAKIRSVHSEFSSATSGYSNSTDQNSTNSLNKICEKIYKKSKTEINKETQAPTLKNDTVRFCVKGGIGTLTDPK